MTLSAEFSVNGNSAVQEHTVAYGASVSLAVLSLEFRTIAWSIVSSSKAGSVAPTISLGGTPTGSTATFNQVEDPLDGLGRAWVVRCLVTDSQGNTATAYRVIGTVNASGILPICADEQNYRDATHGWSQAVNEALNAKAEISGLSFNVKDFGATGNGVTDDTTAIQNALDAALATGGIVRIPRGTYVMSAGLTVTSNVTIEGEGDATVLDFSSATATTVAITAIGSQGVAVPLAGDAAKGATSLNVSGAGFSDGDWALVFSEASTGATGIRKGEIVRINSAASMTLYDPLCDSYAVSDSASVAKLTLKQNVHVRNLKILGPSDGTVAMSGVLFDTVLNGSVSGLSCERTHFYGVGVLSSVSVRVSNCYFNRNERSDLGYGVAVFNASHDVSIVGCTGWRMRHLVTHGGFSARYGVPRRTVTTGCVMSQAKQSAYDCHAGSEDISFVGNICYGSLIDGITFEGSSGVIAGNILRDSLVRGINVASQTARPLDIVIANNKVSGEAVVTDTGIRVQMVATFELVDNVAITGNTVSDCVRGIDVASAQTGRFQNVAIVGNTLKRAARGADECIGVRHAEDVTVSGNAVHEDVLSTDGITLNDVTRGSVTGNSVRMPNGGTCRCIRLISCQQIVITGNVCSGGTNSRGVDFDSSTTNCTVGANNLRGCAVGMLRSSSTGTGHSVAREEGLDVITTNTDLNLPNITYPSHRVVVVDVDDANWDDSVDAVSLPTTPVPGERVTVIARGDASVAGDNVPIDSADTIYGNVLINTLSGTRTYEAISDTEWQLIAST